MEIEPLQMTPVKAVTMSAESHLGETLAPEAVKTFGEYLTDSLKEANRLQSFERRAGGRGDQRHFRGRHCQPESGYRSSSDDAGEEQSRRRLSGTHAHAGVTLAHD